MHNQAVLRVAAAVVFAAMLVAFGDRFVLQRTADATSHDFTIRDDALVYAGMVTGAVPDAPPHFQYRVLVPFLAGLLPVSPLTGLWTVSYLSLLASYLVALWIGRRSGLSWFAAGAGLLAVYTARVHLYNFHNPYLTDAFALLVGLSALALLLERSFRPFVAVIAMGMLTRETAVFLAPAWLATRQWRRAIIAVGVALFVFAALRVGWLSSTAAPAGAAATAISTVDRLGNLGSFVKEGVLAWSFLWAWMAVGLLLMPRDRFVASAFMLALLCGGAVLTSLAATDTGRMFAMLSPVVVLTSGYVFAAAERHSRLLTALLGALLVAQLLVATPTVVAPFETWEFMDYRPLKVLLVAGLAITAVFAYAVRAELLQALALKHAWISGRPRTATRALAGES